MEMGPDVLLGGVGGANAVTGAHSSTGIARLGSPARHFILNRRKWWCCGVRRRKKSGLKHNTVSASLRKKGERVTRRFVAQDRLNNANATTNEEELDEELGDFQLPLSLTPRASGSTGLAANTTNVIQHRPSTSSLQHNVVLHSTVSESATNRFDLNVPVDADERSLGRRKANSLTTVQEHEPASELSSDESRPIVATKSLSDTMSRMTTDGKPVV